MTVYLDSPQSSCRLGIARGDITPPVGIYHRMWGAATHDVSVGVHRPLEAHVLVLRDEQQRCPAAPWPCSSIARRAPTATSFTTMPTADSTMRSACKGTCGL